MPIQLITTLLATFGPPAVELIDALIKKWEANGPLTLDEWNQVKAILRQTPADKMRAALAAASIPLDDPKAIALLDLVK